MFSTTMYAEDRHVLPSSLPRPSSNQNLSRAASISSTSTTSSTGSLPPPPPSSNGNHQSSLVSSLPRPPNVRRSAGLPPPSRGTSLPPTVGPTSPQLGSNRTPAGLRPPTVPKFNQHSTITGTTLPPPPLSANQPVSRNNFRGGSVSTVPKFDQNTTVRSPPPLTSINQPFSSVPPCPPNVPNFASPKSPSQFSRSSRERLKKLNWKKLSTINIQSNQNSGSNVWSQLSSNTEFGKENKERFHQDLERQFSIRSSVKSSLPRTNSMRRQR